VLLRNHQREDQDRNQLELEENLLLDQVHLQREVHLHQDQDQQRILLQKHRPKLLKRVNQQKLLRKVLVENEEDLPVLLKVEQQRRLRLRSKILSILYFNQLSRKIKGWFGNETKIFVLLSISYFGNNRRSNTNYQKPPTTRKSTYLCGTTQQPPENQLSHYYHTDNSVVLSG
jgi:hypothetical protein